MVIIYLITERTDNTPKNTLQFNMNKILLSFIASISLFMSCNNEPTKNDIIRKNAEELIKNSMHDPASYEFVSIEVIDSDTYKNNINQRKNLFSKRLASGYRSLSFDLENNRIDDMNKTLLEIKKDSLILVGIDSIENSMKDKINDVISYTYLFKIRGKNEMGVKILSEYYIQTNAENNEIINLVDDEKKLYLTPFNFPGYEELIKLDPK